MTVSSVAKKHGVSRQTVYNKIKAAGIVID